MRSPRSPQSARSPASSARASRRRSAGPLIGAGLVALTFLVVAGCGGDDDDSSSPNRFDGAKAMSQVRAQVAVGQRPAGSEQLRNLAVVLRDTMGADPASPIDAHFETVPSSGPQRGLRNIVAVIPGRAPAILIGAHYDTEYHPQGFVGANDGAAGTAAVVELARALPDALPEDHREIRLVLFDGEEEPPGCRDVDFQFCALRGSRAYAAAHPGEIGDLILLDYIANRGARFQREANSNEALWAQLREAASEVGTEEIFAPGVQGGIIDDHYPFLEQGVPSIDLIDFNYAYADTVEDTADKLDPAVLDQVGETVTQLVVNLNDQS